MSTDGCERVLSVPTPLDFPSLATLQTAAFAEKDGITVNLGGRCSGTIQVGERLRIETPGGGGYGAVEEE